MRFELYSGAGNRFLLTQEPVSPSEAPALARLLCAREIFEGKRADGLLILERVGEAVPRLTIYNADGGRPEACGNGLRCAGWHLARSVGHDEALIATDAGTRRTRVHQRTGPRAMLYVDMGPVRVEPMAIAGLDVAGLLELHRANVGNPHCVLRVMDERPLDTEIIGLALQTHELFPAGVNVGFLAQRGGEWHLRVFERGVGETDACGTGACAAAAVALEGPGELPIQMRGGRLRVRLDAGARAELYGHAEFHGSLQSSALPDEANPWVTCSKS